VSTLRPATRLPWQAPTALSDAGAVAPGYLTANLTITAGDADEVVYGLGQGNWTDEGGCPADGVAGARIVPLERNGQSVRGAMNNAPDVVHGWCDGQCA
jgi:hypothetical protein